MIRYVFNVIRETLEIRNFFLGGIKQIFWKGMYEFGALLAPSAGKWTCMNHGFIPDDGKLVEFDKEDEEERTGITSFQLYHEVASQVPIEGKDVVEIGCGRGGGAAYIAKYLKPKTMTAIDISSNAVKFANAFHKPKSRGNIHFQQGHACNIPLRDGLYDAVVNVESFHCYPDLPKFYSEVYRILKPGGHFLVTDIGYAMYVASNEELMKEAGFIFKETVDIGKNVVASMKKTTQQKEELIIEILGKTLYKMFGFFLEEFCALEGSRTMTELEDGKVAYIRWVLQKPE
jgi:ubiquinone/menaquinone biosynthesis C-methylase UbiE